jgi:hypothetical protein
MKRLTLGFLVAAVLACLLGLAWPASAQHDTDFQGAWRPTILLLGGGAVANNLGENPGPVARLIVDGRWWEAETRWDGSSKTNVALAYRGGWIASQRVDAILGPVLIGGEYIRRNGGIWSKDSEWVRVGYARINEASSLHFVFRMPVHEAGTPECPAMRERAVQFEGRLRIGHRWVVAEEHGLLFYRSQGAHVGYYMVLTAGVVLGRT